MAQELVTTFLKDVDSVTLKLNEVSRGYALVINDEIVFDRKGNGFFSEIIEQSQ